MALNLTMFKDILKEQGKYSQGRVYLFASVVIYYATIGLLTCKAIKGKLDIDTASITQIIDAVQWALLLFSSYVFGGKGLDTIKVVAGKVLPQAVNPVANKQAPVVSSSPDVNTKEEDLST